MIKQYASLMMLFLASACVHAEGPTVFPSPSDTANNNNFYSTKLMQPVISDKYFSHYKTSELQNVKIPKDFNFVNERRLRFLMEQGEYRTYALNWELQGGRDNRRDRFATRGCKEVLQHFMMANDDKPQQIYTRDNKKLMVINDGNHEKMAECIHITNI
jgi:hypothetical protein